MTRLHSTLIVSALFATALAPAHVLAQGGLRDRLAAATEAIEASCADDVSRLCGNVTRGEGRLLLCMQAHEDQLSRSCQFTLYRASRNLGKAFHRVERIADACWGDIQAQCGNAEKIGQCVVDKRGSLSKACQRVVGAVQQVAQGVANLRGMRVSSSDDKEIGRVVATKSGPDGKIRSIEIEVGQFLGLGSKVISIDADRFEQLADKIRLRILGEQIGSMPDAQRR